MMFGGQNIILVFYTNCAEDKKLFHYLIGIQILVFVQSLTLIFSKETILKSNAV
jgi:hypothetical protein